MKYLVLLFSLICLISCEQQDQHFLFSESSKNESLEISIYYTDAWSFGPHDIQVYINDGSKEKYIVLEEKLYNDGSNLLSSNVTINWRANELAEIYINGAEMETLSYLISKRDGKYSASLIPKD